MSFYLQQGYGMMGINKEFADKVDNLGVILSPRSLQKNTKIENLEKHAHQLKKKNVKIMFDPQFYVPRTNMEKILKFPYFKDLEYSTVDFNSTYAKQFCKNVLDYQIQNLNVDELIIPNIFTNSPTDDWFNIQEYLIEGALESGYSFGKYLTLSLGPDFVKNKESFDELISRCTLYDVEGYYIVLKSPKDYLIDDEEYLYSLLDAFISLNLSGKKVILGYSNQQCLIYGAAGVTSIASGNFRNVRSFDPEIFFDDDESEDIKRKGIWYYDGNTFSEFKIPQLSLAYRRGLREYFGPHCDYCSNLLKSENPANVPWKEGEAFKHYLFELRNQWISTQNIKVNERIDYIIKLLENVEETIITLKDSGFRLGSRAFDDKVISSSLNALYAIKSDRKYDLQQLKDL
ncbi:hypothetical protein ABEY82_14985 [Priestia megaterium]